MCVEVEHDADVLLSLSALIKAGELRIVFEGILLKDTPIKVRVLRASWREGKQSYGTPVLPFHSSVDLTHDLQSRVTSKE